MFYETIKTEKKSDVSTLRSLEVMKSAESIKGETNGNEVRYVHFLDVQYVENVVTVLARAFNNDGSPIGFGKDGTVEIERFRIINPPTLVEDINGDIVISEINERTQKEEVRIYREDPKQALMDSVLDIVRTVGKDGADIIPGKIGTTTTTVYSDTGDCALRSSNAVWATARNATSSTVQSGTSTSYIASELEGATYNIYAPFLMFDTSGVPSGDVISSATFSIYLNGDNQIGNSQTLAVGQSQQATWNSPASGDFDARGHTATLGSGNVTHPSGATTGYLDFTLDATGIGFVAKSGETKPGTASATGKTQLSIIYSSDSSNTAPTARCYSQIRMAEQSGTTSDPKLVIEHSAASARRIFVIS